MPFIVQPNLHTLNLGYCRPTEHFGFVRKPWLHVKWTVVVFIFYLTILLF